MNEDKYFLISVLGHNGSYEYIVQAEAGFEDKATVNFIERDGIIFETITGECVAIGKAMALGLTVKQISAEDAEEYLKK